MILSTERISYLAHKIWEILPKKDLVTFSNKEAALTTLKNAMTQYFGKGQAIHQKVKEKIASLKRQVLPGSTEWDILYQKYYEEESKKMGF